MTVPVVLSFLLGLLLAGFVVVLVLAMRRRRRLWFVGEAANEALLAAEERGACLQTLKELEEDYHSGKIAEPDYQRMKAEVLAEARRLTERFDFLRERARVERDKLERELTARSEANASSSTAKPDVSSSFPAFFPIIFAALYAVGNPLTAQDAPLLPDAAGVRAERGEIEVELYDPTGLIESFADTPLVVAFLPDDHLPFDEFTQMQWTGAFESILDPHRMPSKTELALAKDLATMRGVVVPASPAGRFTVDGLPAHTRLATALKYDGVWWPLKRELWLDEDGGRDYAKITVYPVSGDLSKLTVREYAVEAYELPPREGSTLSWLQVVVSESITLTNTSPTHAIVGQAALNGGDWLRLPLVPPPGQPPVVLTSFLLHSWAYFIGEHLPHEAVPFERENRSVFPYVPWTFGKRWQSDASPHGAPHGAGMPHGAGASHAYAIPGAKRSGDNAHPLNERGDYDFLAPGTAYLAMNESDGDDEETPWTSLDLVVNKPIPPGTSITIRLEQRPGFLFSAPMPITLRRPPLGIPVQHVRLLHSSNLIVEGLEGLRLEAGEPQADGLMRPRAITSGTETVGASSSFALRIAPGPTLADWLRKRNEALPANERASTGASAATEQESEAGLRSSSLYWTGAVVFGLATLVSLVWSARGTRERQLERLHAVKLDREAALRELLQLDHDYRSGKLPAAFYREERARLVGAIVAHGLPLNGKTS